MASEEGEKKADHQGELIKMVQGIRQDCKERGEEVLPLTALLYNQSPRYLARAYGAVDDALRRPAALKVHDVAAIYDWYDSCQTSGDTGAAGATCPSFWRQGHRVHRACMAVDALRRAALTLRKLDCLESSLPPDMREHERRGAVKAQVKETAHRVRRFVEALREDGMADEAPEWEGIADSILKSLD